jgi:hypothetical protein
MPDIAYGFSRAFLLACEDSSFHKALMHFLVIYVLQIYLGTNACNLDNLEAANPQPPDHVSMSKLHNTHVGADNTSCPTISTTISNGNPYVLPLSGCCLTWSLVTREGLAPPAHAERHYMQPYRDDD